MPALLFTMSLMFLISVLQWISKYGLEKLGLCFEKLVPGRAGCHGDQDKHRTVYKHINHHVGHNSKYHL